MIARVSIASRSAEANGLEPFATCPADSGRLLFDERGGTRRMEIALRDPERGHPEPPARDGTEWRDYAVSLRLGEGGGTAARMVRIALRLDDFERGATLVQNVVWSVMASQADYLGHLLLLDRTEGVLIGVQIWRDAASLERALASGVFDRHLRGLSPRLAAPAEASHWDIVAEEPPDGSGR